MQQILQHCIGKVLISRMRSRGNEFGLLVKFASIHLMYMTHGSKKTKLRPKANNCSNGLKLRKVTTRKNMK